MHFPNSLLKPTDNKLALLMTGPAEDLSNCRKFLTLQNKSVSWRIHELKKSMKDMQIRGIDPNNEWYQKALVELNDIKDMEYTYLFENSEEGITIPIGFYYLAPNASDFMKNDVSPYYIDGLRDYQIEFVKSVMSKKRTIGMAATGAGKARCIASIALSYVKTGKRVLVVVPSDYLVGQLHDTIKEFHDSVAAAGGGRNTKLGCDILVVTYHSAMKHADMYQVLIMDEAHHSPCATYQNILLNCENIDYVHSLTATPFRADGLDLVMNAWSGDIVHRITARELIERGWLVDPDIHMVNIPLPNVLKGRSDAKRYKEAIQTPEVFAFVYERLSGALAKGFRCMVVFKTVIAGQAFKKFCKKKGLDFTVATGTIKGPLYNFANDKTQVLVATDKLVSEGLDFPKADCMIVCTMHSSDVTSYQILGRILRKFPGKEKAILIDVSVSSPVYDQGTQEYVSEIFKKSGREKRAKVYSTVTDKVFGRKV